MIILPAIDLKDGTPVRLTKGAFDTVEQVADNALQTALDFVKTDATWLHMVDLDGALQGKPVNHKIIEEVVSKTSLKVEVGGGIRTVDDIKKYIDAGVSRVILGSVALKNPELVKESVSQYGDKIAVGIDAMDGYAKTEGWLEGGIDGGNVYFTDLAKAMEEVGVATIIFTDISKDGTLSGPNLDQLKELQDAYNGQIIASGGIRDIDNIKDLAAMDLYGAICGKSIYSGTLNLKDALAYE
ncbi:MAG: 1-(5-phosphoribosyl)-5-[(5-phosphoribosylamino)methylideneamino]imidazole-4-carboxamide isomerase [Clostridiales Family XIII bacterium]|nr:1-(5-phosphoribosyl)-5-[(5-phosphoribosylamino)methylideneamino]imidazole-4-carboxamide isomerase [Clostridiales Family XIII bacterium]